ncbi:MAG: FAD-binding oxidoreductase [Spirochaetia bacterium]|nr:FAD-binding oxidoreductase [Spirochaetia bacterium]
MIKSKFTQKVNIKPLDGDFRQKSFWLKTLPEVSGIEPLKGSTKCDIAVIGGGFTGLSTAYNLRLLLPGVDVRVMEANICGFGSSGRNGGFSSTLFGMDKSLTALRFGKINAISAHHYMEDAVEYLEGIIEKNKINCEYEKRGSLLVATTPSQTRRIDQQIRLADKWNLEGFELWDEKRLADEFNTKEYHRGMYYRKTGLLNPALLTRGSVKMAREAGAIVHEMSPVRSIKKNSTGFCIYTPDGELKAEKVIFATNAYSILFSGLSAKQTPIFQNIIVSEPLSREQINSIGWQSRCGIDDARTQFHYYRLTSDNRLLIGGGNIKPVFKQKIDQDHNEKVFTLLRSHILKIFPQLRGLNFTHEWGGPVSITVDMAPAISFLGRNQKMLYSLGLMGHGVSMAPYNGLCLAELVAGKKTRRTEMFFVGRKVPSWPPHLIRFPLLQFISGIMKAEDRFRWD